MIEAELFWTVFMAQLAAITSAFWLYVIIDGIAFHLKMAMRRRLEKK